MKPRPLGEDDGAWRGSNGATASEAPPRLPLHQQPISASSLPQLPGIEPDSGRQPRWWPGGAWPPNLAGTWIPASTPTASPALPRLAQTDRLLPTLLGFIPLSATSLRAVSASQSASLSLPLLCIWSQPRSYTVFSCCRPLLLLRVPQPTCRWNRPLRDENWPPRSTLPPRPNLNPLSTPTTR